MSYFKSVLIIALLFIALFLPIVGGALCAGVFAGFLMDEYDFTLDMTAMPSAMIFIGHSVAWLFFYYLV